MSAYPVLGKGTGFIPPQKLKMAMCFSGKNRHYEWEKIHPGHIQDTARRCGMESILDAIRSKLIREIPKAIEVTSKSLPKDFPDEGPRWTR